MSHKQLPVVYPTITSWNWQACLFAILGTIKHANKWIFNNYIQISCRKDRLDPDKLFLDFVPNGPQVFLDCAFLNTRILSRKHILENNRDVRDFFMQSLDSSNYIFGIFNEGRMLENNDFFPHELFIFGYDHQKSIFDVADFTLTNSGKYEFSTADMDIVCNAFLDITNSNDRLFYRRGGILLINNFENPDYHIDVKHIVKGFYSYLYPKYYFDYMNVRANQCVTKVFGVDVYDLIMKSYLKGLSTRPFLDVRLLSNLYDHKVLMVERVKYLVDNDFLNMSPNRLDELAQIRDTTNLLKNVCLKMRIKQKHSKSGVMKIVDGIKEIKEKEIVVYNEIIKNMESCSSTRT